jgi:hypothetical protein
MAAVEEVAGAVGEMSINSDGKVWSFLFISFFFGLADFFFHIL